MKKLIIIAVVLIFIMAGIGIFIATFDINLYKGLIAAQLDLATGNHVEIGRLSLKWEGRALLGVYDLKIYQKDGADRTVLLSLERADASVELMPLLARRIHISSISLKGLHLNIDRTKEEKVEIAGYDQKAPASVAAKAVNVSASPKFSMNIGFVEITDSSIRFRDMMSDPAADIVIRKIKARIDNISGNGPIKFTAKMAVVSPNQNLTLSGSVGGLSSQKPFIRDLDLDTDLAEIDHAELIKSFPSIAKLGLSPGLAGAIKVKLTELEFSEDKISKLSMDASLKGGRIVLSGLKVPVERIDLIVSCKDNNVNVRSFSAEMANGSIAGSGTFKDIFTIMQTTLRVTVEVKGLREFILNALGQKRNMDGNARLTFDGSMTGRTWPEISKTLSGKGDFYLDRGMMMNTNVLNQTLNSLTLFPGLPEMVRGYVPAPIQQAFGNNDTVIEPLRQTFTIEGGYVMIPNLNLRTDTFDMQGDVKTSLTGDVSGNGIIRFGQSVSDAMVKAVPEIKYLTNSQGMVEFPMAFKSGEEGFKVIPDMKYVGKKVAVEKAGQMVTDFLQKASKDGSNSKGAPNAAASEKAQEIKDLLNSFIDGKKKL